MSSIPRSPITLGGITVDAFLCHCGGKLWPVKAYRDHRRQAHGGADVSERVCARCHKKQRLLEFITKDHLIGMVCKKCRQHADKGRKRSNKAKRSGRRRQYSNVTVVLSDRVGFRSI